MEVEEERRWFSLIEKERGGRSVNREWINIRLTNNAAIIIGPTITDRITEKSNLRLNKNDRGV